jgi:hypothetical protein
MREIVPNVSRTGKHAPLLLVALLLVTSCSSGNPGLNAKHSSLPPYQVFINDCGVGDSQQPMQITLTCADGGMYLDEIKWTTWTSKQARGSAIYNENTCKPECASGKMERVQVEVIADQAVRAATGEVIFTRIKITSSIKLPNGLKSQYFDISPPDF